MPKSQRIRDPIHDLIEFGNEQLEQMLWKVIQTQEFQRLRRIKQLGFSDFVYPGATHTRFSHSLGVYFIAKKLLKILEDSWDGSADEFKKHEEITLAAALLHDIGHGPFSHAFEEAKSAVKPEKEKHEAVSAAIIKSESLANILTPKLSESVANLIQYPLTQKDDKAKIFDTVISSQFDADRLDYMQRDRLMTGTRLAGIDLSWLLSNLKPVEMKHGAEKNPLSFYTFVLDHKAIHAAEAYVLALFHLYPTVYFHKTTRGVEKLFISLFSRFFKSVFADEFEKTNLPRNHPLTEYVKNGLKLEDFIKLDDTVVMGGIALMTEASEPVIKEFATRIIKRDLYKCFDVSKKLIAQTPAMPERLSNGMYLSIKEQSVFQNKFLSEYHKKFSARVAKWQKEQEDIDHRILTDTCSRKHYKDKDSYPEDIQEKLDQITIGTDKDNVDIYELSHTIKAVPELSLYRVYHSKDDRKAKEFVEKTFNDLARDLESEHRKYVSQIEETRSRADG